MNCLSVRRCQNIFLLRFNIIIKSTIIICNEHHDVSDFMKGSYKLIKNNVGIDIAKLNHFATAVYYDNETMIAPLKFTNDANGFQLLIHTLK